MQYYSKITLKDGRECVIYSGNEEDGEVTLDLFNKTHEETDFLLTLPDECNFTVQEQSDYMKKKYDSENEVELIATVDGVPAGIGGVDAVHNRIKTRHRADFGVSVLREYGGIGIGRALLEACIELAKKAGYEQLELDVVADNANAVSLYKSVGFTEYGRNPRGFKSPVSGYQELIQMRLELR
ncbi:MAG: GNAT family N-acetyltransferase [Eubacterium sp.]|nr:GNAT family N-acetyltransferase [Eubacterium sp.]